MRARPWRSWLGAQLRSLADAVDAGPRDGMPDGPRDGPPGPPGGASGRARESAPDGVGTAQHPGDAPPEVILGMNLTGAPEHWARLVRESATRWGGDQPVGTGAPADPVIESRGPRTGGRAPGRPAGASGQQQVGASARQDVPPTAPAPGGPPAPSAPEPPAPPRPGVDARSNLLAGHGVSRSTPEGSAPPAAAAGGRMTLRPPSGPAPRTGRAAIRDATEDRSTTSMAPPRAAGPVPPAAAGPVPPTAAGRPPARLAVGYRVPAKGDGTASRSSGARPADTRGGTDPDRSGDRAGRAADRDRLPTSGGRTADLPRPVRAAPPDPAAAPGVAAATRSGQAAPGWIVTGPGLDLNRAAAPPELGRWPELPTRPTQAIGRPSAALSLRLTRVDRLNQEQAAV